MMSKVETKIAEMHRVTKLDGTEVHRNKDY